MYIILLYLVGDQWGQGWFIRLDLYFQLIQNYDGDVSDIKNFRKFLPQHLKRLATDIDKLCENLVTISELATEYDIIGLYMTNACYGCQNDCPGQRDHMECDTGCLHDPQFCEKCRPF